MSVIKKFALAAAGTAMVAFGSIGEAQAISFSETGDAGRTLGTARVLTGTPGTNITSISGSLGGNADLFKFYSAGGSFRATTVPFTDIRRGVDRAVSDTQLFLFDANGFGVLANDDASDLTTRSTIEGILSAGFYYLGISGWDFDPVSRMASGSNGLREIFPDSFTGINGPTGPGGSRPLQDWRGSSSYSGTYRIDLTGAQVVGVPEPASVIGLLAVGALGIAARKRTKSQKAVQVAVES